MRKVVSLLEASVHARFSVWAFTKCMTRAAPRVRAAAWNQSRSASNRARVTGTPRQSRGAASVARGSSASAEAEAEGETRTPETGAGGMLDGTSARTAAR